MPVQNTLQKFNNLFLLVPQKPARDDQTLTVIIRHESDMLDKVNPHTIPKSLRQNLPNKSTNLLIAAESQCNISQTSQHPLYDSMLIQHNIP